MVPTNGTMQFFVWYLRRIHQVNHRTRPQAARLQLQQGLITGCTVNQRILAVIGCSFFYDRPEALLLLKDKHVQPSFSCLELCRTTAAPGSSVARQVQRNLNAGDKDLKPPGSLCCCAANVSSSIGGLGLHPGSDDVSWVWKSSFCVSLITSDESHTGKAFWNNAISE